MCFEKKYVYHLPFLQIIVNNYETEAEQGHQNIASL